MERLGNLLENPQCWREGFDPIGFITRNVKPMLFRADGDVISLRDPSELLDFNLRNRELYVFGPHGWLSPFAVLALRQGLLTEGDNRMMHIDAHWDNNPYLRRPHGRMIDHCLDPGCSSEEFARAFYQLINRTLSDVCAFISDLRERFSRISAFVDPRQGLDQAIRVPLIDTDDYCCGENKYRFGRPEFFQLELSELVRSARANIFSIDGDFTGSKPDERHLDSADLDMLFAVRMKYLIEGFSPELDRGDEHGPVLYGLSLDSNWVIYPERFLENFIERFYLKLIRTLNRED